MKAGRPECRRAVHPECRPAVHPECRRAGYARKAPALAIAFGLLSAAPARAAAPAPADAAILASVPTAKAAEHAVSPRKDERIAPWLRALRAAELAGDGAAIDALERDRRAWPDSAPDAAPDAAGLLDRRVALARRMTESDAASIPPAERRATVRARAAERLALAEGVRGLDDDTARLVRTEWRLEAVEDLVLRAPAAGAVDFAIAAAFVTRDEGSELAAIAREARAALDAIDRDHAGSPTADPAATIATDPVAFRRAALDGLVGCLEVDLVTADLLAADLLAADLVTADLLATDPTAANPVVGESKGQPNPARAPAGGKRSPSQPADRSAHARARLLLASRCELPLPRALGEILALAEARMIGAGDGIAASDRRRRADLLAVAARASDPALELLARIELWRDQPRRGAFPTPVPESRTLAILATLAEVRLARVDRGVDAVEAPVRALLARTAAGERDPDARATQLATVAGLVAERLPESMLAIAATLDRTAPERTGPVRTALAIARLSDDALARDPDAWTTDRLRAVALDPLLAPLVAIRSVGVLAGRGDARAAADLLAAILDSVEALPNARALAGLLLELRRAEAAAGADGEIALDAALAIALRRFPSDPAAAAWSLERVDLALLPRHTLPNAGRAESLLAPVPRSAATRDAIELRAIEAAELALPARGRADSTTLRARTAALRSTLAAPADDLLARLAVVEARLALREGLRDEAIVAAARALAAERLAAPSAFRACAAWAEAVAADIATATDSAANARGSGRPPIGATPNPDTAEPAVLAALRRSPAAAAAIEPSLALVAASLDDARRDADAARTRTIAGRHARPLAEAVLAARPASAEAIRTLALADLVLGRTTEAIARLDAAHGDAPADRALTLALADALAADGAADARARAFALYRDLSPLSAPPTDRDAAWWCAQLGQLEILAGDPSRTADILARLNRLAAIDPDLGASAFRVPGRARATTLERRFEDLRRRLADGGG